MHSTPDLILSLWTAARAMFARLRAAIGESAVIAGYARLNDGERRSIRVWLRPLEAMVRKIVLIEAMALALEPEAPSRPRRKTTRARAGKRRTSLRLWPRNPPPSRGPRIRALGPDIMVRDIYRDRARLALARHLSAIRGARTPEGLRVAARIDALERVIARPRPAARRLARKLRVKPSLALKLAVATPPRSKVYAEPEYALSSVRAYERACAWSAKTGADTS
jgi:hypothetical protein